MHPDYDTTPVTEETRPRTDSYWAQRDIGTTKRMTAPLQIQAASLRAGLRF